MKSSPMGRGPVPELGLSPKSAGTQARPGGQARIRAIISHYTLEKKKLGETMQKFREGQAEK